MATTVKELLVRLGVDADNKNLKNFASGMQKARRAAGKLTRGVAAVAGGATAATGVSVVAIAHLPERRLSRLDILARVDRDLAEPRTLQTFEFA